MIDAREEEEIRRVALEHYEELIGDFVVAGERKPLPYQGHEEGESRLMFWRELHNLSRRAESPRESLGGVLE